MVPPPVNVLVLGEELALSWPDGDVQADFVVPVDDRHGLLNPAQAHGGLMPQ